MIVRFELHTIDKQPPVTGPAQYKCLFEDCGEVVYLEDMTSHAIEHGHGRAYFITTEWEILVYPENTERQMHTKLTTGEFLEKATEAKVRWATAIDNTRGVILLGIDTDPVTYESPSLMDMGSGEFEAFAQALQRIHDARSIPHVPSGDSSVGPFQWQHSEGVDG